MSFGWAGRHPAWAVVVAAGTGARFGGYKQFSHLGGREVLDWSLAAAAETCAGTVLVLPAELVGLNAGRAAAVVAGGVTRSGSVRAGLALVPSEVSVVVVHDAARPLAQPSLWERVITEVRGGAEAAVPCVPVTDTVKQRGADGHLVTLDRSTLVASQTPQGFSARALRAVHASGGEATDDAALVEAAGGRVVEVPGDPANFKLTSPTDLRVMEILLQAGLAGPVGSPRGQHGWS